LDTKYHHEAFLIKIWQHPATSQIAGCRGVAGFNFLVIPATLSDQN